MAEKKEQFNFIEPEFREIVFPNLTRYADLIDPFFTISTVIEDTGAATAANYGSFFIAPISCEVIEMWEGHRVAGTDVGAVTLDIEKLVSGDALDSGVSVLQSTANLKGTINTPQRVKAQDDVSGPLRRFLKPGDRLALKDSGTLTAVAHVTVTVLLRVLQTQIDLTT